MLCISLGTFLMYIISIPFVLISFSFRCCVMCVCLLPIYSIRPSPLFPFFLLANVQTQKHTEGRKRIKIDEQGAGIYIGRTYIYFPPFFLCVCVCSCVWYNRHYITVAIINWLGNNRIHSILHGISPVRPGPHPSRTKLQLCFFYWPPPPLWFFCVCLFIVHTHTHVLHRTMYYIISDSFLCFLPFFLSFSFFPIHTHTQRDAHTLSTYTHTHTNNNDAL